jgi:hypothetical protein
VILLRDLFRLNVPIEDLTGNVGVNAAEVFLSHQLNRLLCIKRRMFLKRREGYSSKEGRMSEYQYIVVQTRCAWAVVHLGKRKKIEE